MKKVAILFFITILMFSITACSPEPETIEGYWMQENGDTVSFNSLKGRTEELDWIKFWCSKLNIDYVELYNDGLCITDISDINLLKTVLVGGIAMGISAVLNLIQEKLNGKSNT